MDIDPFDLDAAVLRKNEGDMRAFLTALAARLEQALPCRVTIERKRDGLFSSSTHVVRIELATDNAAFTISLDRAGVKTTRAKVVRGVTISNASMPAKAWMDEVRSAVAALSGASDEASNVIGGFLWTGGANMSWFGKGKGKAEAEAAAMAKYRQDAWAYALKNDQLPEFVETRLKSAAERKVPWLSTMTSAELLLGKSHGLRPLATVSGTCWYHYGYSWTNGHAEGWDYAIARLKREALAAGANAVVDVQMRKVQSTIAGSMDFTLFGTAVKFDALPPSSDPVIATVSALDFVRLLEMGIAVCGIAVGASYDYLEQQYGGYGSINFGEIRYGAGTGIGFSYGGPAFNVQQALRAFGGNVPVMELTNFWESIRRDAHAQLRRSAGRIGNGVLARTQFGQLIRVERDKMPPNYLGRHIVIGTVVETKPGDSTVHHIETVVDMRAELSPLIGGSTRGNDFDDMNEQAGGI